MPERTRDWILKFSSTSTGGGMAISFTEATQVLLSGGSLAWNKFGENKGGSVTLSTPGQRRVFAYLLAQDRHKVAQGDESLFHGLIAAWKDAKTDPASEDVETQEHVGRDVWRLRCVEASNFGGLALFGSAPFELWIDGVNWCLEGQNGSGKTSFVSSILWALTGKRIREQEGVVDEYGKRSAVVDKKGKLIGEWPSFASYPTSAADLIKTVEVWVRLTFTNAAADVAVAYLRLKRRTGCLPPAESPTAESEESSKYPADSTCNPLEHSPLCQSR